MILTRIVPASAERIDTEDPSARSRLEELYAVPASDWLRLNLIQSVNGSAAGVDGTSESLTNRCDRMLLGIIRGLADVVLVGAASVRAEGFHLPRTAPLAILTGSGDLGSLPAIGDVAPGRLLVLCPRSAVDAAASSIGEDRAEIVVVPDDSGRVPVAAVVAALAKRGLRRIVGEGGPSLAGQLLNAGLVDEICLSTGPVITGTVLPLFGGDPIGEHRLELSQLLLDEQSSLYARWRLPRP